LFGVIEIADPVTGKALGNIGTGFNASDQRRIYDAFHSGAQVILPFVCQGFTEAGIAYQARLDENF
jgi:hypothetical protein